MNLKSQIRAVQQSLPITQRHEAWMRENADAAYSERACDFAWDVLRGNLGSQRERKPRRLRGSGTGKCGRQRILKLLGAKDEVANDSRLSNIFHTGNFLHLKWQMAGFTEGWLADAEVPVVSELHNVAGTMDGVLYDGSGFEFKSINSRGFSFVTSSNKPKQDHIQQVHVYMLMSGLETFSVVYENKDNQEWREFRVVRDEQIIDQIVAELDELNEALRLQQLPDGSIKSCLDRDSTYRNCPVRDACMAAWNEKRTWL